MTHTISELLEDIAIQLEVDALTEEEMVPYLQNALDLCGVRHTEITLDGLVSEAQAALGDDLVELARRGPDGKFIKGSGRPKPSAAPKRPASAPSAPTSTRATDQERRGKKMAGSLMQRVGKWIGKTAVKAGAYVAGKAIQGVGSLAAKSKGRTTKRLGKSVSGLGSRLAGAASKL